MKYFALLFCFMLFGKAYPCDCMGKPEIKSEIRNSNVILSGVVLKQNIIEEFPDKSGKIYVENLVLVETIFKGKIINDTLKIYSGLGKGDCGYWFTIGKKYIIYAQYSDEFTQLTKTKSLYTNICMRTDNYNEEEVRKLKRYSKL